MPVYDYKCEKTSKPVTRMVKCEDAYNQKCKCGSLLQKQISCAFIVNANSGGRS